MVLTNIPIREETITDRANEVREKLAQIVNLAEIRLQEIRNLVRTYGRSALATELDDDAQALLTVYSKLKEAIEAAKGISVEELP